MYINYHRMVNHFGQSFITSPAISLFVGYVYITFLSGIMYYFGLYSNSTFFSFGVPVTVVGTVISDYTTYYTMLALLFVHQLLNNWISEVTYPWIINCVQDQKSVSLVYSRRGSMLLVNLFALYSELDMVFIVLGVMSQLPFLLVLLLANVISVSVINWQYIKNKAEFDFNSYSTIY